MMKKFIIMLAAAFISSAAQADKADFIDTINSTLNIDNFTSIEQMVDVFNWDGTGDLTVPATKGAADGIIEGNANGSTDGENEAINNPSKSDADAIKEAYKSGYDPIAEENYQIGFKDGKITNVKQKDGVKVWSSLPTLEITYRADVGSSTTHNFKRISQKDMEKVFDEIYDLAFQDGVNLVDDTYRARGVWDGYNDNN